MLCVKQKPLYQLRWLILTPAMVDAVTSFEYMALAAAVLPDDGLSSVVKFSVAFRAERTLPTGQWMMLVLSSLTRFYCLISAMAFQVHSDVPALGFGMSPWTRSLPKRPIKPMVGSRDDHTRSRTSLPLI
jgi:hypothetical protein